MDNSSYDGPPPLICKKEILNNGFFPTKVVSTKECPLLITLDDDDDDDVDIRSVTDEFVTAPDNSSENTSQNNNLSAVESTSTVTADPEMEFKFHREEDLLCDSNNEESNFIQSPEFQRYSSPEVLVCGVHQSAENNVPNNILDHDYACSTADSSTNNNICLNNLNYSDLKNQGNVENFSFTISDVYQLNSEVKDRSNLKENGLHFKKTPLSALYEFCQYQGVKLEIELLSVEICGTELVPVFHYRARVGDVEALGKSKTRKKAKQIAAENLLKKFSSVEKSESSEKLCSRKVEEDRVLNKNPIGVLQEICMHRKWPLPEYGETWDPTLLCTDQFKTVCSVLKFREIGFGKSRKLSKREAALKMLETLKKSDFSELNNEKKNTTGESLEKTNQEKDKINEERELLGKELYLCGNKRCVFAAETEAELKDHLFICDNARYSELLVCPHCKIERKRSQSYLLHLKLHGKKKYTCGICDFASGLKTHVSSHMLILHGMSQIKTSWKEASTKGHSVLIPKEKNKESGVVNTGKTKPLRRRVPSRKFLEAQNHAKKNYFSGPLGEGSNDPPSGERRQNVHHRRRPKILSNNDFNRKDDIVKNPLAGNSAKRKSKDSALPSSPIIYKFKCGVCNEFEGCWRKEITKHLEVVHGINRHYTCKLCNMQTNERMRYISHFAKSHQGEKVSFSSNILKFVLRTMLDGKKEWSSVNFSAFQLEKEGIGAKK